MPSKTFNERGGWCLPWFVALLACVSGCGAKLPSDRGTWYGRVVAAEVFDRFGNRYPVAVFEIRYGSDLNTFNRAFIGDGDYPLLVDARDRCLHPAPFDPDKEYRVSGTLIPMHFVYNGDRTQRLMRPNKTRPGKPLDSVPAAQYALRVKGRIREVAAQGP